LALCRQGPSGYRRFYPGRNRSALTAGHLALSRPSVSRGGLSFSSRPGFGRAWGRRCCATWRRGCAPWFVFQGLSCPSPALFPAAVGGVGLAVDAPLLAGVGVGVGDAFPLLAPEFCAVAMVAIAVTSARI